MKLLTEWAVTSGVLILIVLAANVNQNFVEAGGRLTTAFFYAILK